MTEQLSKILNSSWQKVFICLILPLCLICISSIASANMTQVKKLLASHNYAAAEKTLERMYGQAKTKQEKADISNWLSYSKFKQRDLKGAQDQSKKALNLYPKTQLDANLAHDASFKKFWQDNRNKTVGSSVASSPQKTPPRVSSRSKSSASQSTLSAKGPVQKAEKAPNNRKKFASKLPPPPPKIVSKKKAVSRIPQQKTASPSRTVAINKQSSARTTPRSAPVGSPPKTTNTIIAKKPLPQKTILLVTANEADAAVSIDGIVVGKVGESLEVDPGTFIIHVSKPGYITISQKISIVRGQTLTTAVQLNKPVAAPPPVVSSPKKATVSVAKNRLPAGSKAKSPKNKPSSKAISEDMFGESENIHSKKPRGRAPDPRNKLANEFEQDRAQAGRPQYGAPQQDPYYGIQGAPYTAPPGTSPPPYGYAPVVPQAGYGSQYPGYAQPPGYTPSPYQQPNYGGYAGQQQPVAPGYSPPPAAMDSPQLPPAPNPAYVQTPPAAPEPQINSEAVDALYSGKKAKSRKRGTRSRSTVPTWLKLMPFGAPQFAGGQYVLGSLFATGQVAALYLSYDYSNQESIFVEEVNATVDRRTTEINALTDETQKQAANAELEKYVLDSKKYQNNLKSQSQMMLGVFGGLWLTNIATAYIFPPQSNSKKRISEENVDTSPSLQASLSPYGHFGLSYIYKDKDMGSQIPLLKLGLSINPFHDYNSMGHNRQLISLNVGYTLR